MQLDVKDSLYFNTQLWVFLSFLRIASPFLHPVEASPEPVVLRTPSFPEKGPFLSARAFRFSALYDGTVF